MPQETHPPSQRLAARACALPPRPEGRGFSRFLVTMATRRSFVPPRANLDALHNKGGTAGPPEVGADMAALHPTLIEAISGAMDAYRSSLKNSSGLATTSTRG